MVRLKILCLLFLITLMATKTCNAALAAIAIDLGHQYTKIALVKPGVPMEIVLNKESQRKTDTQIGVLDQTRFFGDSANNNRVKYPRQIYGYFIDLLGKKFDHPAVHIFQKRFPYYKLVPDPSRGTVLFENDENSFYSVETLVGMIIAEARKLASKFADQEVKDAIVTVPAFFNQAERRAMVEAAEIGGVNLLQLMNDNAATGINYGMFRRKQFNETSTKVMIYDMGAMYTTATVYEYTIAVDKISREKNPQMTILGVGFDRTLGGLEITLRLRDHLAKIFQESNKKKLKNDIRNDPKAMNKLLKEAERVKKVLSANPEHAAQIENLFEDLDMKIVVNRKDVEDLFVDLIPRFNVPVTKALEMAEMSMDDMDYFILMGGGTRLPKVQESLQKVVNNKELSKFLNTDEAIVMGAVYQAAHRSKGFKVKKFLTKDLNLYPIVVDFEKEATLVESEEKSFEKNKEEDASTSAAAMSSSERQSVRRTLFNLKNQYPQKRKMTFSKHSRDFEFFVNYGDLSHLSADQLSFFGELNISRIYLGGITETVQKHSNIEGITYKGAKAHFRMDESGILQLEGAEVSFEKTGAAAEADDASPSTFQKIGQKISSFFSGSSSESAGQEKKEKETTTEQKSESTEQETEAKKEGDETKQTEEKQDTKAESESAPPSNDTNAEQKAKNVNGTTSTSTNETAEPEKPKIVQKDFKVKVEKSYMDIIHMTKDQMKESLDKLKALEAFEKNKLDLAMARNDLESFVIDTKYKLIDDTVYSKVCEDKEREQIIQKCDEINEWLEEHFDITDKKEYESRLSSIKELTKDLSYKVKEATERPQLVQSLTEILNYSNIFLTGMKNFTIGEIAGIYTEVELNKLEKVINETQKWLNEKQLEQSKLSDSVKPTLTVQLITEKTRELEREVQYLLTKAKYTKPKSTKKEDNTSTAKNDTEQQQTAESNNNKKKTEKTTTEETSSDEKVRKDSKKVVGDDDSGDRNFEIPEESVVPEQDSDDQAFAAADEDKEKQDQTKSPETRQEL